VTGLAGGPDVLDAEAGNLSSSEAAATPAAHPGGVYADLDFGHGHGGRTEHPAPGDEPAGDAVPSWSPTPPAGFDPPAIDTGADLDLRTLPGEHPAATDGDEPDELDGL
jgi:hypothetical protein